MRAAEDAAHTAIIGPTGNPRPPPIITLADADVPGDPLWLDARPIVAGTTRPRQATNAAPPRHPPALVAESRRDVLPSGTAVPRHSLVARDPAGLRGVKMAPSPPAAPPSPASAAASTCASSPAPTSPSPPASHSPPRSTSGWARPAPAAPRGRPGGRGVGGEGGAQ